MAVAKSWDYPVWGSVFGGVYIMPGRIRKRRRGAEAEKLQPVGGGLIDELAPGHGLITFI